jgi:4-hydroxy-tetrahydrodipicolinate synthase
VSAAKARARAHLRGIWAATLTPFRPDLSLDEEGWRRNLRHWYGALGIQGLFVNGKQGEFASMTPAERKRTAGIAVEEAAAFGGGVMVSCSDQSLDTVVELARHAQAIGAHYVVVHTPLLYFGAHTDDTIYEYYRDIAQQVEIGVVLWNQPPDCGYLLEPELCMRLAAIPNVVAIKYSVPRETYAALTRMAGDRLIVSSSSEEEWLDNILELGWQVYLCSTPPYLLQSAVDRRMHEYTELAMRGEAAKARAVHAGLEPVRRALKSSRPPGKAAAHQKYWQELLGQAGGAVRRPLLALSEAEKAATRAAFESCGLRVEAVERAAPRPRSAARAAPEANAPLWPATLHHLRRDSPEPERLAEFYARLLGDRIERLEDGTWLVAGQGRALIAGPGEAGAVPYYALALRDAAQLERYRAELSAQGIACERAPTPLFAPGAFAVTDPDGRRVAFGLPQPLAQGAAGNRARLQHFVCASAALEPLLRFYRDALGMAESDRVLEGDELAAFFLRSDPEHHSFAAFRAPQSRADHHSYETSGWNDIRDWGDRMATLRIPLWWGPGRHGPGNNLFFMIEDPDGHKVEFSAELERMERGAPYRTWPHEQRTLNLWGSAWMRS